MDWYIKAIQNYAIFEGRARRKEYWMFILINFIFAILAGIAGALLRFPFLISIYTLFAMVPGIAVSVRRLHDTNRSGWLLLLNLVPIIGPLLIVYWFCLEGSYEANQYGPSPKARDSLTAPQ